MKIKAPILVTAVLLTLGSVAVASSFRYTPNQIFGQSLQAQLNTNPTATLELQLNPIHPDEPVSDTFNQRFAVSNSLQRMEQIEGALTSFRQLTEKSRSTLGEPPDIKNTDWETQSLGFPNWVGSVEGTLKKQDYQIKRLEFELAQKQFQDGEISQAALDDKAAAYEQATQEFQAFWNSFRVAD